MKGLPYGVWRYVLLLIVLLVLASLASLSTVSYLETNPELRAAPEAVRIVSLKLFGLTMGFLFLSGAFGLWAIRSTVEMESQRRIGRLVEAMNYMADGVLAVDGKGRVAGSNAAARALCPGAASGSGHVLDWFDGLSVEDVALLLDASRPQEVERKSASEPAGRTLRFRCEPLEGMHVMLISDVSEQRSREIQSRQAAQLQLIGRIAQGVAFDFNNILCAISGHASLLLRRHGLENEDRSSVGAVLKAAERGAGLARQLLELSRTQTRGQPSQQLVEHLHKAGELIRAALPNTWRVQISAPGTFPAVPFTGIQLEQLVLNLAWLVADEREEPGVIHIEAAAPDRDAGRAAPAPLAAIITVLAGGLDPSGPPEAWVRIDSPSVGETGVIFSVLRTMIEEVGGRLELYVAANRRHQYRLLLPRANQDESRKNSLADFPDEIKSYIGRWSVLLAGPDQKDRRETERRLTVMGVQVKTADNLVSALAEVESGQVFQAMVVDRNLLGAEVVGLLRAILKLQPGAGIVLLNEPAQSVPEGLKGDVVFEFGDSTPERILPAMIRARELAGQRSRAA